MLRKSPYVDENYNYITSMMDNMDLQGGNSPAFAIPVQNENIPTETPSLFWNDQQSSNFNITPNVRNIDEKKHVEVSNSIYGNFLPLIPFILSLIASSILN